jgi:two-component system, NarL family, sensor histidine kinase DevS
MRSDETPTVPPALLTTVVDRAPDAILLVDPNGRIVFANHQSDVLFGYEPQELLGKPVEFLVPEAVRHRHVDHRAAYHKHPGTRPMGSGLELAALCRDGTELPVEISLSPLEAEDGTYVTAIVRDVSVRKALEDERQQLRAAGELQADRERIARDLHDGVMQAIYGVGLNLMELRARVAAGSPEAAAELDEVVTALSAVIGDIRSYVMNLPLERVANEVTALFTNLVDEFREQASIAATIDIADVPPLTDEQKLTLFHVAQEALANIRKHSQAQQVVLRVTRARSDVLRLEVRDDGVGFDAAAHQGREHMGLRNMRARAEQLGGDIEVESAPGAGTVVRLTMPLHVSAHG